MNAVSRAQYRAHVEERKAYQKAWYHANKERVQEWRRGYHATHRAQMRAAVKRWRAANPEKSRAKGRVYRQTRRARLAESSDASVVDLKAIMARDKMRCHICGGRVQLKDLEFDHIVALDNRGPNVEWNIAVSHRSCNRRKSTKRTHAAQAPLPITG